MRFGAWKVKGQYRSGSLMTIVRKLARYKLDLLCVQEFRWDKGGTVEARESTLFYYRIVMYGRQKSAYGALVERHKGKRPLGRPRRRWEINMKLYFQRSGMGGHGPD